MITFVNDINVFELPLYGENYIYGDVIEIKMMHPTLESMYDADILRPTYIIMKEDNTTTQFRVEYLSDEISNDYLGESWIRIKFKILEYERVSNIDDKYYEGLKKRINREQRIKSIL